ncbi:nucleotidyltransferase domain-containing protein [Thermobifida halotolerans]|uniref:Nucleotidyltransferase domain-containing protein n=1 Tax=Thermobifida halotolerans TaxID=483545 RepID=A0A399G0G7_9ACTN|nr:nucleotidyltransferase domain-containing protein [Thermobifida halotolerans]UOE21330.1 nucleotidyltransferase domain-containing protein [Thermobifida halotolerans]
MRADPVDQARRIAAGRFPHALAAVLAGSTAAGRATAASDLDIAVLLPEPERTRRETIRFEGRLVELFVHTANGLDEVFAADARSRRGIMQFMYATGIVLVDVDGHAARVRDLAEAQLRQGPPPLGAKAVETGRYLLTDALDDLGTVTDPAERLATAWTVLAKTADLLFDHHRAWTGGGKWLPRRLLEADAERGSHLLDSYRQTCETGAPNRLVDAATEVLDLVGGPLQEGYRRDWPPTAERSS